MNFDTKIGVIECENKKYIPGSLGYKPTSIYYYITILTLYHKSISSQTTLTHQQK